MSLSRTALFYRKNAKSRKKKLEYDKLFQKRREQVKKRVECNAYNRRNGKKGDNMDCSHKKNGKIVLEHRSSNRARNRSRMT